MDRDSAGTKAGVNPMSEAPQAAGAAMCGVLRTAGTALSERARLSTVRASYEQRIAALAEALRPVLEAGIFDPSVTSDMPDEIFDAALGRFQNLQNICAALPLCEDESSALLVLLVSRHRQAGLHFFDGSSSGRLSTQASACVSRDVIAHAEARGWCPPVRGLEHYKLVGAQA